MKKETEARMKLLDGAIENYEKSLALDLYQPRIKFKIAQVYFQKAAVYFMEKDDVNSNKSIFLCKKWLDKLSPDDIKSFENEEKAHYEETFRMASLQIIRIKHNEEKEDKEVRHSNESFKNN